MKYLNVPIVLDKENNITDISVETVYNINDFPYNKFAPYYFTRCKKRKIEYYNIVAAFDIESTTIDCEEPYAYMYHWQFCINRKVVFGRTWEEFTYFINKLSDALELNKRIKLVVYVHNLPYEFQFCKDFLNFTKVFAREKRKPIIAETETLEFRCSYKLSNMSLKKFCETSKLCIHYKLSDSYDFKKIRTPSSVMSDEELAYCFNDVYGLCECIDTLLEEDTLATIPITSTGYTRRDFRAVCKQDDKVYNLMYKNRLNEYTYLMCKTASRGGNCHANPQYSNQLLCDLHGYDITSSYPYQMVTKKYPQTPFIPIDNADKYFLDVVYNKACLIDIIFYNLQLKDLRRVAYIPRAKCTGVVRPLVDNGRIISAEMCAMVITDIDYKLIEEMYSFDDIEINTLLISEYDYLPIPFRKKLLDYFKLKTELKGVDEYRYMKSKNRFNAAFGMMLTDICAPEIVFANNVWEETTTNVQKALTNYYKNRNNFLSYQHGIWITAHGRDMLEEGARGCYIDEVYRDTDSLKLLNNYDAYFNSINQRIIDEAESFDVLPYIDYNGKRYYLGVWDNDYNYKEFKTVGAKKYCGLYYDEKKKEDVFIVTVSGLNKKQGAEYIKSCDNFNIGLTVPEKNSGRSVAYYNDSDIKTITVNGDTFKTASNIALVDTTYSLGISDEYDDFLKKLKFLKKDVDIWYNEL